MADEDKDYWVVRIPKPKRFLRKAARFFAGFPSKTITVDVPFTILTSVLIAAVLFIFFTTVVKTPDVVAAVFTVVLVGFYLYVLRSEARR